MRVGGRGGEGWRERKGWRAGEGKVPPKAALPITPRRRASANRMPQGLPVELARPPRGEVQTSRRKNVKTVPTSPPRPWSDASACSPHPYGGGAVPPSV